MQVSLSGHHVEITESLRNYVNEKVEKLDRHFDHALDIHIVLTVEKLRHKAEATLHVSGSNLHADDAIDGLVDKLDRQGKKHKEKMKNYRPKGVATELA